MPLPREWPNARRPASCRDVRPGTGPLLRPRAASPWTCPRSSHTCCRGSVDRTQTPGATHVDVEPVVAEIGERVVAVAPTERDTRGARKSAGLAVVVGHRRHRDDLVVRRRAPVPGHVRIVAGGDHVERPAGGRAADRLVLDVDDRVAAVPVIGALVAEAHVGHLDQRACRVVRIPLRGDPVDAAGNPRDAAVAGRREHAHRPEAHAWRDADDAAACCRGRRRSRRRASRGRGRHASAMTWNARSSCRGECSRSRRRHGDPGGRAGCRCR